MAIWEIPEAYQIDYSPNGDDVDSFSQKVDFCLKEIFNTLQYLHSGNATAGLDTGGTTTVPYETRVNTSDRCIYIRNADNTDWILLGEVAKYFGITPDKIGAVENGYGMGRLFCGKKDEMSALVSLPVSNDFYFAHDEDKLYRYDGKSWNVFLSRQLKDIQGSEGKFVSWDDVTDQGGKAAAGYVLKLDTKTGKANVDITGSPDRLCDYLIKAQDLSTGDALVFDSEGNGGAGAFVNKPFPFKIAEPEDGQVLMYSSTAKAFRNADNSAAGAGKSLVVRDGENVLGEYNGSETVEIDLQGTSAQEKVSQDVAHLTRLVENLYIALDKAQLNPGGYDGLSSETFRSDISDIDTTEVKVLSAPVGNYTITVDSIEGLIEGCYYYLRHGNTTAETVQIERIDSTNRVKLCDPITTAFVSGDTQLARINGDVEEDRLYIGGTGGEVFITKPATFINEATGANLPVSRAHLSIKHDNIADINISAEIALRNATFVKGEIIGAGDGMANTVTLAHTNGLTHYKFAVYFDGELQTSGITFNTKTGEVSFTAPEGVAVSADYFYNWGTEEFVSMEKAGTFPDRKNPAKATTQFTFAGAAGNVATLRLKFSRASGTATNEIVATATGNPQAFRLAHHANYNEITVTPSTATYRFKSASEAIVVKANAGEQITVSYNWRGKAFYVDSFACVFDE